MPRRKITDVVISKTSSKFLRNAIRCVMVNEISAKTTALRYNITRMTLRRSLRKCKDNEGTKYWTFPILVGAPKLTGNYCVNRIYTQNRRYSE